MSNTTQMIKRNLPSAMFAVASLVLCLLSLAKAPAFQAPGACPAAKPSPTPRYESFFGRQGPIGTESPQWRLELARTEPSAYCQHQFLFKLTNKENAAVSQFTICDQTAQVDEVDLIKGTKALVLGRAAVSFWVVNVLDLTSGRIADHFTPFRPALSPDHRFLAFLKDFPPHPGPVAISNEYIVYDLTQTAKYNRTQSKPGIAYDAGWPVYPSGSTNAVGENLLPEGSPMHDLTSARLFWLDDTTLAFTDFFQGENLLVVANLSRGVRDANVRTVALDPGELVDLDQCKRSTAPSDFEVWSKEPAGLIKVAQINLVPGKPGMACLHFVPSPCLSQADLMVKLP